MTRAASKRVRAAPALDAVMHQIRAAGNTANLAGMARYGIAVQNRFGVSMPCLRAMARRIGRSHELALQLWETGNGEARVLAALIDDPSAVTAGQMERWVRDLDSWDVCDGACNNVFRHCASAWAKAIEWSARPETFVKRAAFSLMASLAVHDKQAPDARFRELLAIIEREASDERNFVKKAVNWALRQIGKRNERLNRAAIRTAERIRKQDTRAARWIAADALRELQSEPVQQRINHR